MPASWWAAVDTSDGTKGRATKSDDTELACDWIDFDDTAETGWLRVKYSGTLAASGTQTLKVYPPKAANSSYAASDTYGSDNAYDDDWKCYLPLAEDFADRTSNGNNGTASGTITAGDSAGPDGLPAAGFSGSGDYLTLDSDPIAGEAECTVIAWARLITEGTSYGVMGAFGGNADMSALLFKTGADNYNWFRIDTDSDTYADAYAGADDYEDNAWHMPVGRYDGTNVETYWDGAGPRGVTDTISGNVAASATKNFEIGRYAANNSTCWVGAMAHVSAHSTARSADWIEHEYEQTSDNATFWGAWSWSG